MTLAVSDFDDDSAVAQAAERLLAKAEPWFQRAADVFARIFTKA
jgi:hypothetical protein